MTTQAHDKVEISTQPPGHNLPQKMGRRLWAPMFAMSLLAWPIGLVLAAVRATEMASTEADPTLVARLAHLVPAVMFIGFLAVFAAISFAIVRILGVFRTGGGHVQHAVRRQTHTLRTPRSAKAFMALMMMAMMVIAVAVALHLVVAAGIGDRAVVAVEQWSIVLEAVRRLGTALYLVAITLGLGTIVTVIRFQSRRIGELAAELPPT